MDAKIQPKEIIRVISRDSRADLSFSLIPRWNALSCPQCFAPACSRCSSFGQVAMQAGLNAFADDAALPPNICASSGLLAIVFRRS
jgi:hypothetical protein